MRMVAIGFDEFTHLQQVVQKVLRDLSQLPVEIKDPQIIFGWAIGHLGVGVNSGHGTNVRKLYHSDTPTGLSTREWATMVLREIENHLLAGSRFSPKNLVGGNLEDKFFTLPLERV